MNLKKQEKDDITREGERELPWLMPRIQDNQAIALAFGARKVFHGVWRVKPRIGKVAPIDALAKSFICFVKNQ